MRPPANLTMSAAASLVWLAASNLRLAAKIVQLPQLTKALILIARDLEEVKHAMEGYGKP